MSIAGILDAMRSQRPPAERLVWICLENHANGHRCWPMTERAIAQELNLGIATVERAVQSLVAGNIVRADRHKRRPTVFHMLRDYPKANGQHPPPDDLTPQNDWSTARPEAELTPQNDESSHLTHQNDESTMVALTPQNDESTAHLTHQNDGLTSELTHQNDGTLESTSKKESTSNPPEARAGARSERVPIGFAEFWEIYPRKVSKRDAAAAFAAAVKRAGNPETILAALRQQPVNHNPRFIPYPATWLRGDRWLDEVEHPDAALMRAVGLNPNELWPKGGLLQ